MYRIRQIKISITVFYKNPVSISIIIVSLQTDWRMKTAITADTEHGKLSS
jgi:hypothetical protein